MIFAGKVTVGSLSINQPEGMNHLEVVADVVLPLPTGSGQAVPIPVAQISFDIDKAAATKVGKDLQDQAAKINDSPLVATDLNAVAEEAKLAEHLKRGK